MAANFNKFEHRAVILFLTKKGNALTNIHEFMVMIYGGSALSTAMVNKMAAEIIHGRESLEDDPRHFRSIRVTLKKCARKSGFCHDKSSSDGNMDCH